LTTVISAKKLSKWYGNVLGVSEISVDIKPGIKGLLGPNGAGKSTFLRLISGQLKADSGSVSIMNQPVFSNHKIFAKIGFCPEHECFYRSNTGFEQVAFMARLRGFSKSESRSKAEAAIDKVGLLDAKDKLIREYSMGMRQRLKFACAIVHEPDILMLDEPLKGIDPLWRVKTVQIIKDYAKAGKTVIIASHILPEVEGMTDEIILIHQGKIFAQGDIHFIREQMDSYPHMISISSDQPRKLAELMIKEDFVVSVNFLDDEGKMNKNGKITLHTNRRDHFFERINQVVVEHNLEVTEITSPDDNMQAVFDYLI